MFTIHKSLLKSKETYTNNRERLLESHGIKTIKRMPKDDLARDRKRKILFSSAEACDEVEHILNTSDEDSDCSDPPTHDSSKYHQLREAVQVGNDSQIVKEFLKVPHLVESVNGYLFCQLNNEIRNICSHSSDSILKHTEPKSLLSFSFKDVMEEWKEKTPTFYKFLKTSTENPRSKKRNIKKKGEALTCAQVSAGSKLLNIYNKDMKALQSINNIILMKGGLKKSAFSRMHSIGDCHSYQAAISQADKFAMDWDRKLIEIQNMCAGDMEIENQIQLQLSYIQDTIELCYNAGNDITELILEKVSIETELENHRKNMHPGYYFVGDNVDMVTKVRHMTMHNKHKDQHMYQICAYINRVSGNNLDNTKPLQNANTAPFSQLIPGPEEHETMLDHFTFLVAKKWCQCIQYFGPYKNTMPEFIAHQHMPDTRKRTERVMWQTLYSTISSRDIGTMYAARNITNSRNVSSDPSVNYYASEVMANKFTDAYIVAGALEHFDMESVNSEPKNNIYAGELGNANEMKAYILSEAKSFVRKYVCIDIKPLPLYGPQNNTFKCRYCNKPYKQALGLRKHESKIHEHIDPRYNINQQIIEHDENANEDNILNYTKLTMTLCLLRLNHNDALSMSDGDRIMLVNQYLYLLYKQANCPKYAFGILETVCQAKILLTARLAHRLKWNRTVNHRAQANTNHPNDLDLEHLNKVFKNEAHSYRGIFTEKTISRVSRSAFLEEIAKHFDSQTETRSASGIHIQADLNEDIGVIITQLKQNRVFKSIPGRRHEAFPVVQANPFTRLDMEQVRDWISNSLRKFAAKHYY